MRKDAIALLMTYIAVIFVALYATGCSSSAGGRFYCGFEEVNGISETKTYKTSEIKK